MNKITVQPLLYIWVAFVLIFVPLNWFFAAVFAAVIHEICHIISIKFLGGRIHKVHIGAFGTTIQTGAVSYSEELLCALSGPAGSFLLLVFYRLYPEAAFIGLIHGVFNLLPIYPLDGGRALRCLVYLLSNRPERILPFLESGAICILIILACILFKGRWFILAAIIFMSVKTFLRKIPCKPGRQALQ